MVFKVVMKYSDGEQEEDDEVFETEAEADEYGQTQVSNYETGGEVLHASNPGDHPQGAEDVDYEVIETDD
jgi:hypothetical protein